MMCNRRSQNDLASECLQLIVRVVTQWALPSWRIWTNSSGSVVNVMHHPVFVLWIPMLMLNWSASTVRAAFIVLSVTHSFLFQGYFVCHAGCDQTITYVPMAVQVYWFHQYGCSHLTSPPSFQLVSFLKHGCHHLNRRLWAALLCGFGSFWAWCWWWWKGTTG